MWKAGRQWVLWVSHEVRDSVVKRHDKKEKMIKNKLFLAAEPSPHNFFFFTARFKLCKPRFRRVFFFFNPQTQRTSRVSYGPDSTPTRLCPISSWSSLRTTKNCEEEGKEERKKCEMAEGAGQRVLVPPFFRRMLVLICFQGKKHSVLCPHPFFWWPSGWYGGRFVLASRFRPLPPSPLPHMTSPLSRL